MKDPVRRIKLRIFGALVVAIVLFFTIGDALAGIGLD